MPEYQYQQSLVTTSALPKDYIQNNWSIRADDLTGLQSAVDAIWQFYIDVDAYFSNNIAFVPHPFKCYDRADPTPRAPVLEGTNEFPGSFSIEPLPHECAIVLSMQGTTESGVPQSRRRGRIYFGLIGVNTLTNDAQIGPSVLAAYVEAASVLGQASVTAPDWKWVVWSGVNGSSTIVVNGWVDNEYDTQRRRGRDSTVRELWPTAP